MMSLAHLLNTGWMWLCRREGRAFRRALGKVEGTQAEVLRRIVMSNRSCAFGRDHGFERISKIEDFRRAVPVSEYAAFMPYIDRIVEGSTRELCAAPVSRFEVTSGSTGGRKLVPYTQSLHREFQRGVAAWMWDLFRHRPRTRAGRAYWSISPALVREPAGPHAPPVGIDDDTEYLDPLQRMVAKRVLAVPPTMARVQSLDALRYATLVHLLATEDLAFVSVWSPTFLTTLLAGLEDEADRICSDIRHGRATPPAYAGPVPAPRADPARADALSALFAAGGSPGETLARVWPRLAVISCWADAAAAHHVPSLEAMFPHVEIQPKGLISTEGMVSVPLADTDGGTLAIRSHFLEFEGDDGSVWLAHELEQGGRYRVILTTGGGLYRYRLHDEIEVVGFTGTCPRVRLLGRCDATSDLVGEKLHDHHVGSIVDRVLSEHGIASGFRMLVPVTGHPSRYRLLVEARPPHGISCEALAAQLDQGLSENPYYEHALRFGQLAGCEVQFLESNAPTAWQTYERVCLARGQRAGDIKPKALDAWTGWAQTFEGSETLTSEGCVPSR